MSSGVTTRACIDGNEAAAHVAYRTNDVIAIYPITPSSAMAEWADLWSMRGVPNLWGTVPRVIEMQSEGGAAGAVHGSLQGGALTTTFTASQGLLLMLPNMYKIAGELTPAVFHIAARSLAAQALSIFGDHSDVMAVRSAGWGMLFADSVQQVMDFALIAQSASLRCRLPFLHVFDGFRTSHEVQKVALLEDADIRALIRDTDVHAHRNRALTPEAPVLRGTAQNPDVYFQARETVNPYYLATPDLVQGVMDELAERVGRRYHLFDYTGAPDAERVIVLMGSGCETVEETVRHLAEKGERVGVVSVQLFRPFSVSHFLEALPTTVRTIACLDRTKEPGAAGEPLYQDVVAAVDDGIASGVRAFANRPRIVGGRYGLSSKEFTPGMVQGVFEEMTSTSPKNHFTIGIRDDVTHTSLPWRSDLDVESERVTRAMFWGLGSDGTVGGNKNTIKIIGDTTDLFAQGYFVYDSKKAGARTVSHLRFGPDPIRAPYLISKADFVGVHQFGFLERFDTLGAAREGATFLLNSPYGPDEVWAQIPASVRRRIVDSKLAFHVIDAYAIAKENRLGVRINTIMQTAFFALSDILPLDTAVTKIKDAIRDTYGKRGEAVVRTNNAAVDATLTQLHRVEVPSGDVADEVPRPVVPEDAPAFVKDVTAVIMADRGDELPVSALPADGTYPTATTRFEKRNIALEVPIWEPDLCIQCGKCVIVCPHAVIRAKVASESELESSPPSFKSAAARWRELTGQRYTLQISESDCTGCTLCVEVCPAKDKSRVDRKALNMATRALGETNTDIWTFFEGLPDVDPGASNGAVTTFNKIKNVQLLRPLFEFSSACAGCGETPYLKLMSQLFGDRTVVANATGCSSIYGGNLPATPWSKNAAGRGPAWSNSLFEDNAEFGLGIRMAIDKQRTYAMELVAALRESIGADVATALLEADQRTEAGVAAQRARVEDLLTRLTDVPDPRARDLRAVARTLIKRSVWIVGGDGWAYDIGFGGLDHVLATGQNVNLLVLDTEVYSNTGGQSSKATPVGAVAKFAAGGKRTPKKELGLIAMSYGHVYVAQIALGADDTQTLRAFQEADEYEGPSLILANSPCIAHGFDMARALDQQRLAMQTGYWPLYRFDPRRAAEGKPGLQIDSKPPAAPVKDFMYNENRFRVLLKANPETAAELLEAAQENVDERWRRLTELSRSVSTESEAT